MSIKIMTAVWEHSRATGTDRLVLLALADIADDNGECWPSVAHIAHKCRIDPRTTQRRIRSLQKLGEVVVVVGGGKSSTAGGTRSNRYRIVVHLPEEEEGGDLPPHGTDARGGVAQTPGGGVAQTPPEPSLLTVIEPSIAHCASAQPFEADFAVAWGQYPKKLDRGRAFTAYSARRRSGVSADDLLSATKFYADAVDGTDPKYIKYPATFYGTDQPFLDFVDGIPEALKANRQASKSKSMQNVDRVLGGLGGRQELNA
jgi:hypothetical protein